MTRQESPEGELSAYDSAPGEGFAYPGRELEAMAGAANYHRWILGIFKPFLGQHLVEVGAGLGSFSKLILAQHQCKTLALVEPSKDMYRELVANARQLGAATQIDTYHGTFPEAVPLIKAKEAPDSILYVNVLEHIAEDEVELETIRSTLADGYGEDA